jgi:hypothetical protein
MLRSTARIGQRSKMGMCMRASRAPSERPRADERDAAKTLARQMRAALA